MGKGLLQVDPQMLERLIDVANQVAVEVIEQPRNMRILKMMPSVDLDRGRITFLVQSPELPDVPSGEELPKVELTFRENYR